jgi:peptide/nickel transport system ATP-binding protein/oligopeptide transport system ATP-binding protein
MTEQLLRVDDLRAVFVYEAADGSERLAHVLNGISFGVAAGEVFGLVGESGAGKSIAMRAILGVLPATARVTSGAVRFGGRDLRQLDPETLAALRGREIGLVVQNAKVSLDPLTRVGDQLARLARVHQRKRMREARAPALAMLRAVGIADAEQRARSWPHELSGGMAQRVMIGMALINAPRLLFADEPTTGLDLRIQKQVLELIAGQVADRGPGCVLITHDLGVVANFCDRVAVMFAGSIVEQGPVTEVFSRPAHPYTRALLAAARGEIDLAGEVGRKPPPDLFDLPAGCAYATRCPLALAHCGEMPPPRFADGEREAHCHLLVA